MGEAWIVNPGSPTERRRAPSHTMVVVGQEHPSSSAWTDSVRPVSYYANTCSLAGYSYPSCSPRRSRSRLPRPSSGAAGEQRYVVRPGDTLWALASERFGGDPRAGVWEIRERNGLADALLEPGMVLYLPARAGDA